MVRKTLIIGKDSIPERISLKGEALELDLVALPGLNLEVPMEILLDAPGSSLDLCGVYLCGGTDKLSINVNVRHLCPGCTSRQLFKGIVSGAAAARFNGLIYVAPSAMKTKAYQENHSLLLSGEALSESLPQLEIYADDVECSHGATCGSLDEDARFYMRSRGIPDGEAQGLLKLSFLSPVTKRLAGKLQNEITALL